MSRKHTIEITVPMSIDVDGAPNAYGPPARSDETLDLEIHARVGAQPGGRIVGYLTKNDDGRIPVVQRADLGDPFPGFYVSTTAFFDRKNPREADPRRYVNAAEINYTLLATKAKRAGVKVGDFCVVHSLRTRHTVYAIVGDSGHGSGAEGSLALLQRLGYDARNGKSGGEDARRIVVRYFAETNPDRRFFFNQSDLEAVARTLNLDTDFSEFHAGDPGMLVLDAVSNSATEPRVVRATPFVPLPPGTSAPPYPARLIQRDSADVASVRLIQQRLRDLGYQELGAETVQPLSVDGEFGHATHQAVELFQMRNADNHGRPLEVDGQVGSDTWGALFGSATVHASPATPDDELLAKVLEIALLEIGVREEPPGSNRGKRVQLYQRLVRIHPGDAWCAAFVYFCFDAAAQALGRKNPMIATGGVLDLWNRARTKEVPTVTTQAALDDPSLLKPGMIFIMSSGGGFGHTGIISKILGNRIETIEGNTNDGGSREGIGVFRRTGRTIASINRGFIDYSAA